jgi:spoIIIJ-associated protein
VARQVLQEILQHMNFAARVDVQENPEQVMLTMVSDQPMGLLIGKGGQTLNAIELLVRTIVQTKIHTLERHIVVDAEGYRARHSERLEELARQAAQKVQESGEPVPMEPMNPRDRRTVHMAIAEIEGVASVSAGEEPYRHVVICLPGQCEEGNES